MSEEKKEFNLSENASKILDMVKELSVLELAELVKAMEEEFGVSAAAPVAVAAVAGGGDAGAAEEKSSFDVELTSAGDNKIGVIKAVKAITGEGLKEAKAMVDDAPSVVKAGVAKEEAEEMKKSLEEAGATVTLK
jgi:large subunit ribosomal protein L7/L12